MVGPAMAESSILWEQLSLWGHSTLQALSPLTAQSRKSSAVSQSLIRFPTDYSPRSAQQLVEALQLGCLRAASFPLLSWCLLAQLGDEL